MIKHLTPKSREEVQNCLLNLPASIEKMKLLDENYIELTKKEAQELFKNLSPSEKIKLGIKFNNPILVKKAIKNSKLDFYESREIILWAVQHGYKDISNYLIKQFSATNKILIGTEINSIKLIKTAIKDTNLLLSDWDFQQVIQWSINHGHKDVVKTLFLNDVKTKAKNVQSIKSEYLKTIISYGDIELVDILIKARADIRVDMDSLLIQACNLQNIEIVKRLIEAGAYIHAQDDIGLRSACIAGNTNIVKALLEFGADVHAENDEPLRLAAANGHTEIVKMLLNARAHASAYNYLALYWATLNEHTEIVNILENEKERLNKA
jgi:hypothetical protein